VRERGLERSYAEVRADDSPRTELLLEPLADARVRVRPRAEVAVLALGPVLRDVVGKEHVARGDRTGRDVEVEVEVDRQEEHVALEP
jgi:hypothetical protein